MSEPARRTPNEQPLPFEELDFLYTPSRDVAADRDDLVRALHGTQVFAIEDGGMRVAAIELSPHPPAVLLTDHLEGDRPILVYRVHDLSAAVDRLVGAGWEHPRRLEIPHGPCASVTTPGGHRFALYERTRPDVANHFAGRADF
jgi:hypothetical protein